MNYERHLTTVRVGTIGHVDHGKTTLTAALTRVCAEIFGSAAVTFDELGQTEKDNKALFDTANVEYKSTIRRYLHSDCPQNADYIKGFISKELDIDAAILVVSTADGPMPQTREHIRLARQSGVPYIVVFLNKSDLVDDAELLELVEMEVRDLLSTYDFPGDETPIIIGSARMALEGMDINEQGTTAVKKLVETLDAYISDPQTDGGRVRDLKSQIGFEAEIYILTEEEGGASEDLSAKSRRQIWFHEKNAVTASFLLPESVSAISPGDNFRVTVQLDGAVELGIRTTFKIKDGGQVVGIGIVVKSE